MAKEPTPPPTRHTGMTVIHDGVSKKPTDIIKPPPPQLRRRRPTPPDDRSSASRSQDHVKEKSSAQEHEAPENAVWRRFPAVDGDLRLPCPKTR